jgi:hypothetical protein
MPLANSELTTFGNRIIENLNVLASFDLRTDTRDKRGSRLNIHADGKFERVSGLFAAMGRGENSSLSKEFNRNSVVNLINQAIDQLGVEGISQKPTLRKAIFDGIRGFRWLISSYKIQIVQEQSPFEGLDVGLTNPINYVDSLKKLDQCQQRLIEKIAGAVIKFDQFHLLYQGETQPLVNFEGDQSVYMNERDILGNGICAGISMKWLVRWVIKGKSSILDSKKDPNAATEYRQNQQNLVLIEQLKINMENKYTEIEKEIDDAIARYEPAVWQQRIKIYKTAERARKREIEKLKASNQAFNQRMLDFIQMDQRLTDLKNSILAYQQKMNQRLAKKGGEMTVVYSEQRGIKKGDVIDRDNMPATSRIQDIIQTGHQTRGMTIDSLIEKMMVAPENDRTLEKNRKELEKVRKDQALLEQAFDYDKRLRNQPGSGDFEAFLQKAARKYSDVATSKIQNKQFRVAMYFRDAADFKEVVTSIFMPLVTESFNSGTQFQRTGYYIRFSSGRSNSNSGYQFGDSETKITDSGGHALAFHLTSSRTFLAFDPNFGEFECASAEVLIDHFCRWFSFYSIDSSIVNIGFMRVSNRNDED